MRSGDAAWAVQTMKKAIQAIASCPPSGKSLNDHACDDLNAVVRSVESILVGERPCSACDGEGSPEPEWSHPPMCEPCRGRGWLLDARDWVL